MFSLQPARLSLLFLLLISVVLSDDSHHNGSLKKVDGAEAVAKKHVIDVVSIRQILGDGTDGSGQSSNTGLPTGTGGDSSSTDSPPTSSDGGSQSQSSTTPPPTSTPSDTPTPTPSDGGSSSTTPPSSSGSSTPSSSSPSSKPTSSTPTSSAQHSTTTPPPGTYTSKHTTVHEVTSNGKTYATTDVQTSLIPTNTAAPIDTSPNTSSGMSPQTKKTVIGVVVGVGGAIFLALVFIVFWKFWGRRRSARRAQEDDALMMTSPGEKGDSMSATNPFQSTLESYHAPQRPVNASSNF